MVSRPAVGRLVAATRRLGKAGGRPGDFALGRRARYKTRMMPLAILDPAARPPRRRRRA
jgi:hypothetical protein